jgi:hypothetical protein
VIYVDQGWNMSYAKTTCYLNLPQGDRDPALGPCLDRQARALESFEKGLLFELGAHPACAGASITNLTGAHAPPATGFWRLLISLDDPEGRREPWDLISSEHAGLHRHGAGDSREIARDVCAIAGGK